MKSDSFDIVMRLVDRMLDAEARVVELEKEVGNMARSSLENRANPQREERRTFLILEAVAEIKLLLKAQIKQQSTVGTSELLERNAHLEWSNARLSNRCNQQTLELSKLEARRKELSMYGDKPKKPNPALENVLAKLRIIHDRYNKDSNGNLPDAFMLLVDQNDQPYMTLGDLRRWIESEKEAGK